jgi:predicted HTH domain antitoxin
MPTVHIPYDPKLLVSSGRTAEELEREFRLVLAAKLYELGRLSLGQAAELAGRSKAEFMYELAPLGVSILNFGVDELKHEIHDS